MNIVAAGVGINGLHRCGEVQYIQAPLQFFRQLGAVKINEDLAALLLHINRNGRVGQVDDDTSLAIGAATKIDVGNGVVTTASGT